MTFDERLKQRQAGTGQAPASGVSAPVRAAESVGPSKTNVRSAGNPFMARGAYARTAESAATPYADAARGNPFLERAQRTPYADAAKAANPFLRRVQRPDINASSQAEESGGTPSRPGGRGHQKKVVNTAVSLDGTEKPEPAVEPEASVSDMRERRDAAKTELAQLDRDWLDRGEGQRHYGIMSAFNEDYAQEETLRREDYEARRRALQEELESLDKQIRAESRDGPFEGTYATQLNYAAAAGRESAIPGSIYEDFEHARDFAELSRAGEAKGGKFAASKEDALYNYINDINGARAEYDKAEYRPFDPINAKYQLMTEDERGVYNYLYNKYGAGEARSYLTWLEPAIDKQFYTGRQEAVDEYVGENAVRKAIASAGTVAAQPLRVGVGAAATAEDLYRSATGQGINPYSGKHQFLRLNQGIREEVAEDMSGAGSFLYQTAMSAGDSAVNMALASVLAGGMGLEGEELMQTANKLGAVLMSNEVTANEIAAAKDKGYTDFGALSLGMIRGGIEALTEKVGGDWAIKIFKKNPMQFVRSVLLAAAPEGVEEVMGSAMNEGVNLLADKLFKTKESYIGQAVRECGGNWQEVAKVILQTEGLNFLGGALASVGSSGVQVHNQQSAIRSAAESLSTSAETVVEIMDELGTENPAAVEVLADAYEIRDGAEMLAAVRETDEHARNIEEAMRDQGREEQETREPIDAPPVMDAQREQTPGVDVRAENDAQLQEEQQRREERQAWTEDGGVIPPVVGYETIQNNENGGMIDEEQGDTGEQQRNDAERAGGEALGDEGRAVSVGMDAGDEEGQGRHRFQDLVREKVTAADLGVDNGSTTATVDVLDDSRFEAGSPEARAAQKARDAGLEPVFVTGTLQIGDGAKAKKARAYIKGNRVILQADANVTPEQLLDHELYHQEARRNRNLNGILREALANNMEEQELRDLVDRYITAYDGVYDFSDMGQEEIETICEEELFADLYAGIDNTGRQELRETAKKAYAEAQTGEQQNAEAERETRGPPASREYTYEGLIDKKPMPVTTLDEKPDALESYTRADILDKGIQNIREKNNPLNTEQHQFVHVDDTGYDLRVTRDGLRHGVVKLTNESGKATAGVTLKIGDILSNAIKVNEMRRREGDPAKVKSKDVLLGYAEDGESGYVVRAIATIANEAAELQDIEIYPLLASVKAKKADNSIVHTAMTENGQGQDPQAIRTISIQKLLEIVKDQYPDILSDDVLNNLGSSREEALALDGSLKEQMKYSVEVTPRAAQEIQRKAEETFGTTEDFAEAGYIMPDGKMLRFTDDNNAGKRDYDHRAIGKAYGSDVDLSTNHGFSEESGKYLNRFVEDGSIRFEAGEPDLDMDAGIQLSSRVPLTSAQEQRIRDFIEWKKNRDDTFQGDEYTLYSGPLGLHIDFGGDAEVSTFAGPADLDTWGVKHLDYEGGQINADRIISDIRHYYETGETRPQSVVAQFHQGLASVEVPGNNTEIEQEYKRRHDAYMAASDANDTEYDYKGEIAWMVEAEKQIGRERAVRIANGEITPGQTDGPVSIDRAEQELLDVGEAVVETENGKYRLQVLRQKNGDYMAKVFKDGGEQVARRFSTPQEAAEFASDYLKGQEQGYQDAAEEAERSPEQEPEVPTELPDGKEEEREYIRKKKNEAAKLSNPALRDRILRTQSQIDSLKRMDRNPGTRLTEQQRAHIEDLQETLDILVQESDARKQRAKDRKGKAKEAKAKNKESRNKATESARAARSELMKLWHTADGNKAGTADAINKALEEMRRTGRITEESRRALLDALMDAGTAAVEAESVFADIRRELKNRKVYVSEHDKADFADWKEFRQRAFAAGLYLTNNENDPGADVVNEEMAAAYGEKMFPTDVAAQDALQNLVEKMEQGKEARESLSDAIDHWAEMEHVTREAILDDLYQKTDEILRTFGQKAELEVQLKDQTADMLQAERERFEARLERQAQRHRETKIRDKVLRGLKRLERLKGRADPETKPAVEAVLRDIDTHAKSMSIERLEDLQALQRAYNAAREAAGWEDEEHPGNWIPNKYVEDRLAALSQKHLNEMDIQDVIDLGRTVLALENTIRNNGKMIGEEFDASVAETAQKVREEVESTKGTRGGFLNKWLMEGQLSPTRFLKRLAGWKNGDMDKLAQSLEDGQTRALDFQRRAVQSFDDFLSRKENRKWLEKASGKKATWTEYAAVDGMTFMGPSFTKIELTPMMKVSLYLHSLNNDNLRHIQNGGLVIPNKELYIKGDIQNAYARGARVKMEPEVVRSIVKELTPQEKLFAWYLQKFFDETSKDAINEVSMQLDGFERAGVTNYMPIESSRNFLKTDVEAEAREGTVEGIGSIDNERKGGTNPVMLDDASSVLTRQIDKVSRYYGYAIPIRNFQAVYNHVFQGENGESYGTSMKEVLDEKWLSGANQYIKKMLSDLQSGGQSKTDPLSRALSALRGHLAGATLSFNPSVAVSQTASYPGAAQAVGWDGLAHGLVAGRVDPKLIEKYSPLYWYRNQGNSTQELGDYMNGKSLEQKLPWLLNWIQKMDSATIRRLWAAAEYRVAKDNPDLQKGTREEIDAGESEFYKEVAKVFNRAVYDTQPNYTTMERAQILRSESDVTRFLTMYKTVPLQYYGMMVEAAGRLQAARQSGNEAQVKQAQKYALDTFGGLLAANSVYVIMKALFKGFRKKDKDYRDEEGNLTAGSVSKQLGKDLAETYAGSIIGGAEALSLAKYLIDGGTYHAPEMNALGYVEDMVRAARSIITAMDSQDPRKAAGAIKDAAKTLAMGFGLPASNMETYLLATVRRVNPKVGMEYDNLFGGIDKGDLKGMDTTATSIAAGLILSNRTGERYPESVSRELGRLYEAGERAAVPTDIPESFTYGDTEVEIKDRRAYSDAWGDVVGDSLEELMGSDYYQDADDKTKGKLIDHLFDYATVQARRTADPDYNTTGNSTYGWTARAEEAVANGAALAETITAIVACNGFEADKDENGDAISGTKRAKIIEYLDGLNTPEDHRDALYMATLYSDKDAREKLEAVEDIGISQHTAITALNDMGSMTADKDADGKSIANSKRDKISTYIDAMDLSDSQKDELFILMGYKETSLKYTPWHGYKIAGGGTSGRSGGSSSGRSGRSAGGKTGSVKIPSQAKAMGTSSKSTGKTSKAGGIQTSTASDLIRIIDEMYGGSELAALVDDRRPKGKTKVDFKL